MPTVRLLLDQESVDHGIRYMSWIALERGVTMGPGMVSDSSGMAKTLVGARLDYLQMNCPDVSCSLLFMLSLRAFLDMFACCTHGELVTKNKNSVCLLFLFRHDYLSTRLTTSRS